MYLGRKNIDTVFTGEESICVVTKAEVSLLPIITWLTPKDLGFIFFIRFLKQDLILGGIPKVKKLPYPILFTNPSARAGYDTRSIFKRSLTGLNSKFSFS